MRALTWVAIIFCIGYLGLETAQNKLKNKLAKVPAAVLERSQDTNQYVTKAFPQKTADSSITVSGTAPSNARWVMIEERHVATDHVRQFVMPLPSAQPSTAPIQFNKTIYLTDGAGDYTLTFFSTGTEAEIGKTISRHYVSFGNTLSVSNTDTRSLADLAPSEFVQSDDPAIVALAQGLTQGLTDDRSKSEAIYHWITQNIVYDVSDFVANTLPPFDAVSTLTTHTSVCQGYANLNAAMHRAIGIPSKVIFGDAVAVAIHSTNANGVVVSDNTTGAFSGDPAQACKDPKHAWNRIFIGDKWLEQDPTWDSGYILMADATSKTPPKFVQQSAKNYLFPDPQEFAKTHRYCGENTD